MLCRYLEEELFRRWVGKHTIFRYAFCILYLQIYGGRPDCVHRPLCRAWGAMVRSQGSFKADGRPVESFHCGVTWSDFHCDCCMEK